MNIICNQVHKFSNLSGASHHSGRRAFARRNKCFKKKKEQNKDKTNNKQTNKQKKRKKKEWHVYDGTTRTASYLDSLHDLPVCLFVCLFWTNTAVLLFSFNRS